VSSDHNLLAFGQVLQAGFEADDPTFGVKALELSHLRAIQRQFDALSHGDLDGFVQGLHPDVELDMYGPADIPFIRRARGVEEFRRAVTHDFAVLADQRSEFLNLVAQGNIVVLVGRERGTVRETGMPYDVHFSYEFTFRDGKVVRTRQVAAATEVGT
jgi:ketosteroid isomerase-like protein